MSHQKRHPTGKSNLARTVRSDPMYRPRYIPEHKNDKRNNKIVKIDKIECDCVNPEQCVNCPHDFLDFDI